MENKSNEYYSFIVEQISERYPAKKIGPNKCFYNKEKNDYFMVDIFRHFGAIFVEYANGVNEAQNNIFEDGDLFYPDDGTKEEMLEKILAEING